ncbi:MAG TPA: hypothetical protein PK419_05125 [Spirochaetota bacterium]|jgi:hypothetical protein|nr:hypothetical protein [Spirochaetota bacterium]HOH38427.1 hypothetical protein [Spirochaetota bacterium]HPY02813.1 hypothetical protein [Spirochaetota bacterium]HQA52216.1 hypothetical protein [Spirochaetota bacterium]
MKAKEKDSRIILIEKLETLTGYLEQCNVSPWSKYFRISLQMIINRDGEGINEILSYYGGMGSFNDLYISKLNGHSISEKDESKVNRTISDLSNEIYMLCSEIKRELNK